MYRTGAGKKSHWKPRTRLFDLVGSGPESEGNPVTGLDATFASSLDSTRPKSDHKIPRHCGHHNDERKHLLVDIRHRMSQRRARAEPAQVRCEVGQGNRDAIHAAAMDREYGSTIEPRIPFTFHAFYLAVCTFILTPGSGYSCLSWCIDPVAFMREKRRLEYFDALATRTFLRSDHSNSGVKPEVSHRTLIEPTSTPEDPKARSKAVAQKATLAVQVLEVRVADVVVFSIPCFIQAFGKRVIATPGTCKRRQLLDFPAFMRVWRFMAIFNVCNTSRIWKCGEDNSAVVKDPPEIIAASVAGMCDTNDPGIKV
ncbi:hypothetical protein FPQ18DRAFT_413284 [Pyronema domesticum]|nr:hypothetical protein FPQ18DRAFT_413284 [Pyronema domesticum]